LISDASYFDFSRDTARIQLEKQPVGLSDPPFAWRGPWQDGLKRQIDSPRAAFGEMAMGRECHEAPPKGGELDLPLRGPLRYPYARVVRSRGLSTTAKRKFGSIPDAIDAPRGEETGIEDSRDENMMRRKIMSCPRSPRLVRWLVATWLLALPVLSKAESPPMDVVNQRSPEALEARIAALIEQLGASQYATRQRAKMELKRLRLEAFDALNEARDHDDIEIALSARYLVRSMQVNWWTEEDPREVKQLLREYGQRKVDERRNLMEQLAGLGRELSLRPLCRLVRYEASESLSKQAALLVLSFQEPPRSQRSEYAAQLRGLAGKSKRAAAQWLRAYAHLLDETKDFHQRWRELIARERNELAENPEETSRELTRDLLNWYADSLLRRGRQQESLAMMRESLELLSADVQELMEAADWFRERSCWTIVLEMAERYPDTFRDAPMLQYRLAFALRQLDRDAEADEVAQQAMGGGAAEPEQHLEMAANLQHDGLFEWAEMEYRRAMAAEQEDPASAVRARLYLAEMLHDTTQEKKAAQALRRLVDQIEAEDKLRELVENDLGRELPSIKSRMHYFLALHYRQQGELDQHRQQLLKGYENDPQDADVLIAMYRVSDADQAWRQTTLARIEEGAEQFRSQLKELDNRLRTVRSLEDKALTRFQLALTYNQLAWLIANTEGDYDESLSCSRKSLELQPGRSGFLDTLGRCYYAKGDYENAVKYQEQAVEKEPYSPLIVGQLELFREALRKQQAAEQDQQERTDEQEAE